MKKYKIKKINCKNNKMNLIEINQKFRIKNKVINLKKKK